MLSWLRFGIGMWQAEELTGLFGDVGEVNKPQRFTDHVEQITMLACRGVGPFAGRAFGAVLQADEHGSAGRVADIANLPIVALSAAGTEIALADRLGLPAETGCKIGSIAASHHAASRSPMRTTG
jgi:hypothetical protein